MSRITVSLNKNKAYLLSLLLSILAALIIGGILMAVTGYNPFEAYAAMVQGIFSMSIASLMIMNACLHERYWRRMWARLSGSSGPIR